MKISAPKACCTAFLHINRKKPETRLPEMGKIYKDKKSSGCALCKPHKHGWAPKRKPQDMAREKETSREIAQCFKVLISKV